MHIEEILIKLNIWFFRMKSNEIIEIIMKFGKEPAIVSNNDLIQNLYTMKNIKKLK